MHRYQFAQFITYFSAEIGGAAFGEKEGESPRRRCKSTPLGAGGSENAECIDQSLFNCELWYNPNLNAAINV